MDDLRLPRRLAGLALCATCCLFLIGSRAAVAEEGEKEPPRPITVRDSIAFHEQQLEALRLHLSRPFRTEGTPVVLPFRGSDGRPVLRSTKRPSAESVPVPDPKRRAFYEALRHPKPEPPKKP